MFNYLYLLDESLLMLYTQASWIIQLFNDWFDLFNTQLPVDKFIKSNGMDLENQNKLLKTMDNFILEMTVVGHKTLLPFQKGEKSCT